MLNYLLKINVIPPVFIWIFLQQASHGKIPKELINRLMSILGHLMQLRTLKVRKLWKMDGVVGQ